MLHSARELLITQRTALMNALRGRFAELGIVVAQGARNVGDLLVILERMGQGHPDITVPNDGGQLTLPIVRDRLTRDLF